MLRFFCLGMGLLLAGQAWADDCRLENYGTLPVEMVGSRATTMVKINGNNTRFILDTGAFFNIMSSANASSLGLKLQSAPFGYRVSGIGGAASVQQAHVKEFGILDMTLKNVDFIVGGTDAGNGLLGANLLDFADLEIDLAHGKLTLFKVDHCDKESLAYWVKDGKYNVADIEPADNQFDRRTFFTVTINGKKARAVLDSGASATVLTRDAAERAGIDFNAPDVKVGSSGIGIGARPVKTWTVNIDSFSVGSETIQHSQMQVIDGRIGDRTDMLLGVDFLLAHHMFIANSKRKAYFTYNGGRVFTFATAPGDSDRSDAGTATDENGPAARTADDYALLGQAHLSRGEPKAAVGDLDEAIRMAPDQAAFYVARARAYEADKQSDAALTDLDKSLSLDPKNGDALLMRAELRFAHKDHTGAASDVAAASAVTPVGSTRAHSIASLYIELDQPTAALPMLDDWIRLHNDDAMLGSALNERCWARGLSNQMLDDALKDCRKAIKRDGENPTYLDSLGLVELRLGHYPESIKAYEQAVAQRPRSAWSRYGLGLARIRSGQTDAGNADLVAARTLDPQIESRAIKYGLTAAGP
ncbi:aspartyl protease family protein [Rhodanobacter sp. MP7CTX1]|uniref:aspartyl protease family protein n=1 Tax=Rhodanobacter sp. MP7CTX1 TaxID=2723084 RepID=UPI0017B9C57E|nr:aspartyl protease family protein [Rhodanobacter sp. MP7CTX1]MBB6187701.1 clan AA aspartic protease (TIGR02281 family) [Rhodanobacter sp. MP7CTX1]